MIFSVRWQRIEQNGWKTASHRKTSCTLRTVHASVATRSWITKAKHMTWRQMLGLRNEKMPKKWVLAGNEAPAKLKWPMWCTVECDAQFCQVVNCWLEGHIDCRYFRIEENGLRLLTDWFVKSLWTISERSLCWGAAHCHNLPWLAG